MKYWEQLKEDVFKYKRITLRQYIEHLEKRWVKQDPIVIDKLKTSFFRGWDPENEHLVSFKVRLAHEKKTYSKYGPAITIPDDEITQHYLKEVLRWPAVF